VCCPENSRLGLSTILENSIQNFESYLVDGIEEFEPTLCRTHLRKDDVGRLTQVTEDGTVVEGYGYDLNGNRTSSMNGAGVFDATFDAQDRIETYGNLVFTYTPNGDLLSKTDTATNAVTDYTYDALGNLRGVTLPDGTVIGYLVDGMGRRVGKTVNGTLVKQWLWRGRLQPVAELDGSGNVTARFVYADGLSLNADSSTLEPSFDSAGQLETSNVPELVVTSTATYRLVKDHLGSVRRVVDEATGALAQEIVYDSWGRVLSDSNPGFQPFGFDGGLYESATGLVRFGARDYDAEIGRWASKDPLRFGARGTNIYVFVLSNPINLSDPTGLDFFDDLFCALDPLSCAGSSAGGGQGAGAGAAGAGASASGGSGAAGAGSAGNDDGELCPAVNNDCFNDPDTGTCRSKGGKCDRSGGHCPKDKKGSDCACRKN